MLPPNIGTLFGPTGFDITPNGKAALDDIAAKLRGPGGSKIVVYGYTDDQPIGTAMKKLGITTNMELSGRRAAAVAAYLRGRGINRGGGGADIGAVMSQRLGE